ncbi:Zn(2)-C6 fungal-type domain-containing protein [Fusarium falciforme]|uniref:Zn(2)-C6 fungal-type domain-containing protein n=1 Tax=Fusarium falciforme TaxID=195108 RepID=UPI0023002483|nr:Zn(2)-C6 fungal-type domain-containing protein [Fusarium falciforme]WAO92407.1 Zn(2)-C6 fungal-type domain-containing protein [Fusarium falciforme]
MDSAYDPSSEAELPSCSGCRKRKLKCSRQKPACSNCERLQTTCVYEARRAKPGLKSGAVEGLNQRLEKVERALFGQAHTEDGGESAFPDIEPAHRANVPSPLEAVLSTLAGELQKLNQNMTPNREQIQETSARKRRRHEPLEDEEPRRSYDVIDEALDDLIDAYFSHVQPWIPMINMRDFRARAQNNREQVKVVLQAMAVATLRYLEPDGEPLSPGFIKNETCKLRRTVLLDALDGLTVENLQALIIIAFTDIGDGNLDKAWPIIGSLTRTVEYMELSVEAEDRHQRPAVLPSTTCLPPPLKWVEEEERRRVFWNIFILDRFSSVVKGWNTSLTAADVCRRLPICGGKWFEDEPAVTPYFGIWDRSRAKIGNSITFLPGHYPSPSHSAGAENTGTESSSHGQEGSSTVDMSMVGAFAYYVESIESLSQITTYFLQTKIDFNNRQEVSSWLTRFKELDLRLVHWKMYLPQQWKDSGISRETMPGVMDPNMTVANATHNISLILLHQRIAYPDAELSGIRLPSLCSADTCYNAAMETANMTTKYLEGSSPTLPVSPQLGICAFVSGRVLLVHWRYYKTALAEEFSVLVDNLKEMSRRWHGNRMQDQQSCFFSQLSDRLSNLYYEFEGAEEATPGCTDRQRQSTDVALGRQIPNPTNTYQPCAQANLASQFSAVAPAVPVGQGNQWRAADSISPSSARADELSAISQILMDNDFLEMDRIISFEDMMAAGDLQHTVL